MKLFIWLRNLWWSRQRSIDMRIFWPICKRQAKDHGMDIENAKAVFAIHAFSDPCWIDFYGEPKLIEIINEMK